jgi:hypothetical protein
MQPALTVLGRKGKGATCIPRFCGIISKLPGLSVSSDVFHTKGVLRLGRVYSTIAQYDQFVDRLGRVATETLRENGSCQS